MKITLTQIFLVALFASLASAGDINGQNVLDRKVSLRVENQELGEILSALESQAMVHFTYRYASFETSRRVSLNVQDIRLENVLQQLFEGQIEMVVKDNSIVLKPVVARDVSDPLPPAIDVIREITGTVVDEFSQPLPGVNILEKGTNVGTTTDASGRFALTVSDENAILVFSFIGYQAKEVNVGLQSSIDVQLQPDVQALQEVVVIGYGTQNKKDVTGSVTSVKPEGLKSMPIQTVQQALQGQAAGVKVRQNGGEPGGRFSVFIRGANSASGDSQPLYVVDGVPLTSGSINTLNPDEIESIDILKDASASAIYGTRAANGVVMITTKLGKRNQPTAITVDGEVGVQNAIRLPDMMNSFEMAELAKEALAAGNLAVPAALNDSEYLAANDNNWYDLATQTGVYQKYNIGISGGSEKTQFLIGTSVQHSKGVIISTENLNATLRINLDHQATERLKVGVRFSGGYNDGTDFRTGELFGTPWRFVTFVRPYVPHKDEAGNYIPIFASTVGTGQNQNPIFALENENRYRTLYSGIGSVSGEYLIAEELTLKYSGGFEYFANHFHDFDPIFDLGDFRNTQVTVTENSATTTSWLSDLTLNYDKNFGDHRLAVLAGTSAQKFTTEGVNVQGVGAANNNLDQLAGQTAYNVGSSISPNGLYSYFGRIFYGFKNKYLVTGTIRRDGSSRFGVDNRWGTFPSGSVGWVLSEEPFMDGSENWLSEFKLRASYGVTGNQDIPNFRYLNLAQTANYANGNGIVPGFATLNPANEAIRWESLKQTDIGMDLGFLGDRIVLTADYYHKRSEGLLTNVQLAPTTGFTGTYTRNVGIVQNRGWEFGLSTVNTTGVVKWTSSINLSTNKNEVVDLGLDNVGNAIRLQGAFIGPPINSIMNVTSVGQPLSAFYGFIFDGIFQAEEAADAAARGLKPGDVRYLDVDGNGIINDLDKEFIGDPNPRFYGGVTNTVSYKGVTLTVFVDFSGGNEIVNGQRFFQEGGTYQLWASREMLDRWTPTNPSNTTPRAIQAGGINNRMNTNFVESGDFVRLNTVSISYDLPKSLLKNLKVQSAQVGITGSNLYFWTDYSGFNPEASTRNDPLTQGIDFGSYPLARTFLARISATF